MLGSVPVRGVAHCAAKLDAGRKVPAVQEEDDEPPLPLEPPQPETPTTAIAATNHGLGNLTQRSYRDYNVSVEGSVLEEADPKDLEDIRLLEALRGEENP